MSDGFFLAGIWTQGFVIIFLLARILYKLND